MVLQQFRRKPWSLLLVAVLALVLASAGSAQLIDTTQGSVTAAGVLPDAVAAPESPSAGMAEDDYQQQAVAQQQQQLEEDTAATNQAYADDAAAGDANDSQQQVVPLCNGAPAAGIDASYPSCSYAGVLEPGTSMILGVAVVEGNETMSMRFKLDAWDAPMTWEVLPPEDSIPVADGYAVIESDVQQSAIIRVNNTAPGMYLVRLLALPGAPASFTVRLDVTPTSVVLAEADKAAVDALYAQCCPKTSEDHPETACWMLDRGLDGRADLCHTGAQLCDEEGHLLELDLTSMWLDGALVCGGEFPSALGGFEKLQYLKVVNSDMDSDAASAAAVLSALPDLKALLLRSSNLTGPLSCDIVLPGLEVLSLSLNQLTGPIPECFTQSPTLRELYLSKNQLTGPLPPISTGMTLVFAYEQGAAQGPGGSRLPDLSAASSLRYLYLAGNGIQDEMPATLPSALRYLNLSTNAIEGQLPEGGLPESMFTLNVARNRIAGGLPPLPDSLVVLDVSDNLLTGMIPSPLPGAMLSFVAPRNALSGGMPSQALQQLINLQVASNQLEGQLPSDGSSPLVWADLSNNAFSGPLPASLTQGHNLRYLNASLNALDSFETPEDWDTPNLVTLDLSLNSINATLPAAMARAPYLTYLNLSANALSGPLSTFVQPFNGVLSVFDVSHNQLTGAVPEGFGGLAVFLQTRPDYLTADMGTVSAKAFDIGYNRLSSPFPSFLTLDLSERILSDCELGDGGTDDSGVVACDPFKQVASVGVDGPDMNLTCPAKWPAVLSTARMASDAAAALEPYQMGCVGTGGKLYEVASWLMGDPQPLTVDYAGEEASVAAARTQAHDAAAATKAAAATSLGTSRTQAAAPQGGAAAAGGPAGVTQLGPGAIAGIVIGVVAGVAIIGTLVALLLVRPAWQMYRAKSFRRYSENPFSGGGSTMQEAASAEAGAAGISSATTIPTRAFSARSDSGSRSSIEHMVTVVPAGTTDKL